MSDGFDGEEMAANLTYRIAYGEAHRIVEVRKGSLNDGRDFARKVGTEARELAEDIAHRLGVEPDAIMDAVEDALAGRRPRW